MIEQPTDEELISAIQGNTAERDSAMRYIFMNLDWKGILRNYLRQKGGEQDVDEIFQKAIIVFDRNIRQGKYLGKSNLKTYFFSIAKHLWWKELKTQGRKEEFQNEHYKGEQESVEVEVIRKEQRQFISMILSKIGDRCKKILELYQLDYSMEEISVALAMSNANMAKKEAYRCRKKLKRFIQENPGWKDLIN